jgi:hypothetical protein
MENMIMMFFSFHEKDSESQRIVIENLSKYLLRKTYITNILIGKIFNYSKKKIFFLNEIFFRGFKKMF